MIAAIPTGEGSYIWLDPTSSTCPYGYLPARDQGRVGFLIGDTSGTFVDIPVYPAEHNRLVSTTELWLNREGGVHGKIHILLTGQYNLDARWTYKQIPPTDWKQTLATELSQLFPNIHIEDATISELDNPDAPVEIKIDFRVENYAMHLNQQLFIPLPIDEFAEYAEIVAAADRKYPLDLSYPMTIEKTIQIHLPDEWTAVLPKDIKQVTGFAALERFYRQRDDVVIYRLLYTLKQRAIPATDYAGARQFFNLLASEDGSRLLINMTSSSTSSTSYQ